MILLTPLAAVGPAFFVAVFAFLVVDEGLLSLVVLSFVYFFASSSIFICYMA